MDCLGAFVVHIMGPLRALSPVLRLPIYSIACAARREGKGPETFSVMPDVTTVADMGVGLPHCGAPSMVVDSANNRMITDPLHFITRGFLVHSVHDVRAPPIHL